MPASPDASLADSATRLAGTPWAWRSPVLHSISQEWRRRRTETADLCSVMRSPARIDART